MTVLSRDDRKNLSGKKIATLLPRSGQIALVCDTPPVVRGCLRSLFILSAEILVPERLSSLSGDDGARRRRRGGPAPLSFSVTMRNYKGESAFKDYEEDLSSSINKHNCPRSWRGRNSSWINLRATAISRGLRRSHPPSPILPVPSSSVSLTP